MINNEDLLTLIPVADYQAPKLPTYEEHKPDLLKKVPSRWKNKAAIAITAGLLGGTALTGCSAIESIMPNRAIYCPDLHHGGAGGGPIYVVYLTEQEALAIIRDQLEAVGLNLNEVLPPQSVTIDGVYVEDDWSGESFEMFRNDLEMQLLDEEHQIGVALVNRYWGWAQNSPCTIATKARIAQTFSDEHGILVGTFFRRSVGIGWGYWDEEDVDEAEIATARTRIENEISDQVESFIHQLREQGKIE